jgi:hypothetical protein
MKKYLSLLPLLLLLVGCEPEPPRVVETLLLQDIQVNGKSLSRIQVDSGFGNHHYIYYFHDPVAEQPITVNYRQGKTSVVVVLVDGKPVSTNQIKMP